MVSLLPISRLPALLLCCGLLPAATSLAESSDSLVVVTLNADPADDAATLSGRVLVTAQDGGILVEERNGTLHNLTPGDFTDVRTTAEQFTPLNADELATELLGQLGSAWSIRQTDHFVIASTASDTWTEHCARLLETVCDEYFEFFEDLEIAVTPLDRPLAVILFRHQEQLQAFAAQQHPETTFEDVPGYYSSRSNQMYATDISSRPVSSRRDLLKLLRKKPRHTETIVHEAVHLLGYNTGLHTRQADNPLWFTEGLAAYFEPVSGRGKLLWTGPGRPNAVHLRQLRAQSPRNRLAVPLPRLIQDNRSFGDSATAANAYASSWGLTYGLLKRHREAFADITRNMQQRAPLVGVDTTEELKMFSKTTGMPLEKLEIQAASTVRRLRIPSR